jgi:uncharacterized protein YndB with AHSA1/START domain
MSEFFSINGQAQKTKTAFRLVYSAGIHINAKPERVWALMTNAGDFPRWNSTVKSIEGTIASDQTIKLVAAISPKRVFNLQIIEFVPKEKMVWSDGNVLFKGVGTYTFSSKPDMTTDFTMTEVYTGLMMPMIAGSLPDFAPVFEQYLADLKREAERA